MHSDNRTVYINYNIYLPNNNAALFGFPLRRILYVWPGRMCATQRSSMQFITMYIRAICIFITIFFFSFPTTAHRRHLLFSVIRRQNRLAHARTIIIIIIIQIDASRARARACCNNDMTLKKKYGIVRVYNNIILYCIHYTYKTILLCTGPAYRHRQGQTRGTTTRAAVTRTQEDF